MLPAVLTLYPGVFGECEWSAALYMRIVLEEVQNCPDRQDQTPTLGLIVCQSLYVYISLLAVCLLCRLITWGNGESHFGLEYKPPITSNSNIPGK